MTQPDITYAISYLGRFNHNLHPTHWATIKYLLHYLKETSSYKLVYKGSDDSELFQTYSNTSYKESGCSTGDHTTIVCVVE